MSTSIGDLEHGIIAICPKGHLQLVPVLGADPLALVDGITKRPRLALTPLHESFGVLGADHSSNQLISVAYQLGLGCGSTENL